MKAGVNTSLSEYLKKTFIYGFLRAFKARCCSLHRERIKPAWCQLRLQMAESILPKDFFCQGNPSNHRYGGYFVDWKAAREEYIKAGSPIGRDGNRVYQTRLFMDMASRCAQGDYAEFGTHRGAFAKLIWSAMPSDSKLYCFDTFEGFSEEQARAEKQQVGINISIGQFRDTCVDEVQDRITGGQDSQNLILRKGYFPDTYKGLEDHRWRFIHLDCDLYEPTKEGLRIFWPRLVGGGVMLVHDYNASHFVGVKKAVNEFFLPLGITPVPCMDKSGSCIVVKDIGHKV